MTGEMVNTLTGEIMGAEVLVLPSATEVELYDDPGQQIVLACQRANAWLQSGLAVPIEDIVQTKAQAAALAAFAIQKQLGKDAELSALEVQRRAERGIGLSIRRGQDMGEIETSQEGMSRGGRGGMQPSVDSTRLKPRPLDYATQDDLRGNGAGIYHLTDGVSDEQFNNAITEAKVERNLSRANVVRKVKGVPAPTSARHELLRKTHHHDSTRIARETVHALDGLAMAVALIDDYSAIQVDTEWATALTDSLRALNRFSKSIKEMTHVRIEG